MNALPTQTTEYPADIRERDDIARETIMEVGEDPRWDGPFEEAMTNAHDLGMTEDTPGYWVTVLAEARAAMDAR